MATSNRPRLRLTVECRRCDGLLFAAASVAAGIGPTCAAHERAEQRQADAQVLTLFDVAA
ncbi:DUF6011 domain-containing protein [Nocardia wallacei]|uniref:DUF6011 domain-containing protein n=1 Tax=Nocardia wallacei TaxID=480035 RepID=UPI002456D7CE|nr:DUF6011 domain-containing protein [Nocardia wallacei]